MLHTGGRSGDDYTLGLTIVIYGIEDCIAAAEQRIKTRRPIKHETCLYQITLEIRLHNLCLICVEKEMAVLSIEAPRSRRPRLQGEEEWGGVSPLSSQLRGLGSVVPPAGSAAEPQPKTSFGAF